MKISPMVRTALFVSDLETASAFYADVLGLIEIYFQGDLDHPTAAHLVGMPEGVHMRAKIVKAPGPEIGSAPKAQRARNRSGNRDRGADHRLFMRVPCLEAGTAMLAGQTQVVQTVEATAATGPVPDFIPHELQLAGFAEIGKWKDRG